jgi:hypothetical protein
MATQSLFWTVIFAGAGGVLVFFGLVLEQLSETKLFENIAWFRAWKRIKFWGELAVLTGVFIEVIVAGVTAIQEWQNNPMSGNVSEMSAFVYVEVKAQPPPAHVGFIGGNVGMMLLCDDTPNCANGVISHGLMFPLYADNFNSGPAARTNASVNPYWSYSLQFHSEGTAAFVVSKVGIPVKQINNVKVLRMNLNFLPTNSEIVNGIAELVVNGRVHKMFTIFPQEVGDLKDTSVDFQNVIIATNSDQTFQK